MDYMEVRAIVKEETKYLQEQIDDLERQVMRLTQRVVFSDKPLTKAQYLKGGELEREMLAREERSNLQFKGDPEYMTECKDAVGEQYYWPQDIRDCP